MKNENGEVNKENLGYDVKKLNTKKIQKIYGTSEEPKDQEVYDKKATGIKITPSKAITLLEGEQQPILVEAIPDIANVPALVWTSSDLNIAIVDSDGVITAVKKGDVDIAATSADNNKIKDSIKVRVISGSDKLYKVVVKVAEGCEEMGTVSGGGEMFLKGDKTSAEAVANEGFRFVKWSDGKTAAKHPQIEVKEADIELIATFEAIPPVVEE